MLSLYEIEAQLSDILQAWEQWAVDHEGDVTDFPLNDTLEQLQQDAETKALNIACIIKNFQAEADAIDIEKKRLGERQKAVQNKADRLKAYLQQHIEPGTIFKDARSAIGWRKSSGVAVRTDVLSLPEQYIKFGDPSPKLAELKTALKAGDVIDGVEIEERMNLVIK